MPRKDVKWTDAEKSLVAKLHNEGLSGAEIAKTTKLTQSRNAISNLISRMIAAGDKRIKRRCGKIWTDSESLRLLDMRENLQKPWQVIGRALCRQARECR